MGTKKELTGTWHCIMKCDAHGEEGPVRENDSAAKKHHDATGHGTCTYMKPK